MKRSSTRPARPASSSARGIGSLPFGYFVVIAICGCIIAAGFLFAARQHFVSMDLGMKNSKLRKQLEDLETENRRLMLAREVALSPAEITRTARSLGFVEAVDPLATQAVTAAKPQAGNAVPAATTIAMSANPQRTIVEKTSSLRPTGVASSPVRRDEEQKPRAVRAEYTAFAKLR